MTSSQRRVTPRDLSPRPKSPAEAVAAAKQLIYIHRVPPPTCIPMTALSRKPPSGRSRHRLGTSSVHNSFLVNVPEKTNSELRKSSGFRCGNLEGEIDIQLNWIDFFVRGNIGKPS